MDLGAILQRDGHSLRRSRIHTACRQSGTCHTKDATDAIKTMRENASEWGIKPDDIGIMGSSAGGHLATTVATHADTTARPNFQILFYPVISAG